MTCKLIRLTATFAMFIIAPLCTAQEQPPANLDSAIEVIRASMQADRATMITQSMNFNDKEGAVFWPIYRKYEYERSMVDDRRVAVIKEYAAKYPAISDAEAKGMAERMFDCDARLAALKKKYFKQFNAVLPALTLTKFFQLEHRMDLVMDLKVDASLPALTQLQPRQQQNSPVGDPQ